MQKIDLGWTLLKSMHQQKSGRDAHAGGVLRSGGTVGGVGAGDAQRGAPGVAARSEAAERERCITTHRDEGVRETRRASEPRERQGRWSGLSRGETAAGVAWR